MEKIRKPFQGILNIIRFNWHFYVIAIVLIFSILFLTYFTNSTIKIILQIVSIIISITIFVSLSISYYVYDLSGFYKLEWIKNNDDNISIININAGFDETSELLKRKFVNSNFTALDFYNPNKHTEVSIKRARKIYPPYPNTKEIKTSKIDLESNSIDKVFVILSAHEIRNETERIVFFSELNRILKPKGQIVVIEHLRDISNFMAYNIGSFHFYSRASWLSTFKKSKLSVISEIKNTSFISTFTLEKNGNTL
ncbi:MAG: methyltransferase [Flavobacterium sp.]|nr:MAG: methyltransferase [Flavobacterium sp.]